VVAPCEGSELRANALTVLAALFVVGIGAALLLALAIYFPRQNRLAATHLPRPCFPRGAEREARRWACRATIDALAAPRTRHAFDEILTELTSEACFHGDERAVAYAERVLETATATDRNGGLASGFSEVAPRPDAVAVTVTHAGHLENASRLTQS
jgi:hypothetical protein